MKVFISSVISGMEEFRDAAARAVRQLGHEVLRAEDFGASHESPQVACLSGVRQADAVILLLGDRYGAIQSSGLSATHEEYAEARERCPVLVMVQDGIEREAGQAQFVAEVQDWADGHYTASFRDAESLLDEAVGSLHSLDISTATGPADPDEMLQRAVAMLPRERGSFYGGGARLALKLAGGPQQAILRPAQLETEALRDRLQQMAMFGDVAVLDRHEGTEVTVERDALVFSQRRRSFSVNEEGSVVFTGEIQSDDRGLSAIIEEDVQACIVRFLNFANAVLTHIDPTNRLSHCVLVATMLNAGAAGWRTRAEHAASPNSMTMNIQSDGEIEPVSLSPPHRTRSALRLNAENLAEDLTVKLRRALQNPRREPW